MLGYSLANKYFEEAVLMVPALDVLLQCHHHGQVLIYFWLSGCLPLSTQRIVHQFHFTLPWQNICVAIVKAQWDLCSSISTAIAPNHSDLVEAN